MSTGLKMCESRWGRDVTTGASQSHYNLAPGWSGFSTVYFYVWFSHICILTVESVGFCISCDWRCILWGDTAECFPAWSCFWSLAYIHPDGQNNSKLRRSHFYKWTVLSKPSEKKHACCLSPCCALRGNVTNPRNFQIQPNNVTKKIQRVSVWWGWIQVSFDEKDLLHWLNSEVWWWWCRPAVSLYHVIE